MCHDIEDGLHFIQIRVSSVTNIIGIPIPDPTANTIEKGPWKGTLSATVYDVAFHMLLL